MNSMNMIFSSHPQGPHQTSRKTWNQWTVYWHTFCQSEKQVSGGIAGPAEAQGRSSHGGPFEGKEHFFCLEDEEAFIIVGDVIANMK